MTIFFRAFRSATPFVDTGAPGLLERRLAAFSYLGLTSCAVLNGDFARSAEDDVWLDDEAAWHRNNANDPGGSTLSMSDLAGFNWTRNRSQEETLNFTHFAHAALDGYHPSGGGTGDPDLSKHVMTANGSITVGQPVYVLSSNVVKLAQAGPAGADYSRCQVVALCQVAAGDGNDVTVLTEGHIERNDWTIITGTASLTAGAIYYLGETVGTLVEIPPSTDGAMVVRVGRALTATKLDIEIGETAIL